LAAFWRVGADGRFGLIVAAAAEIRRRGGPMSAELAV